MPDPSERPVAHDGRLLVTHAERRAFGGYLPAVHVQGEITDVMAQVIGVRGHRAQKVRVLRHGEEVLRQWSQHGIVYGQGLRPAGERERLEFDTRHVISGDGVVAEGGTVRQ